MNRAELARRHHVGPTSQPSAPSRPGSGTGGDRRSGPGRSRRTPSRVGPGGQGRFAFWATVAFTLSAAFGVAVFHVLLVQSEFRLVRLEERADAAERRYEQLRLDVARLASPERIVRAAQERLGMVVADEVNYLVAPVPPTEPAAATGGDESWSEVKPHLDAHR